MKLCRELTQICMPLEFHDGQTNSQEVLEDIGDSLNMNNLKYALSPFHCLNPICLPSYINILFQISYTCYVIFFILIFYATGFRAVHISAAMGTKFTNRPINIHIPRISRYLSVLQKRITFGHGIEVLYLYGIVSGKVISGFWVVTLSL